LRSLEIAESKKLKTIAFPSISAGIFGYPVARAATTAIGTARTFVSASQHIETITFCCFSQADLAIYEALLNMGPG
jgi:O-acetyl-ADP-ribose deacetylase (regulator of RNase III)